ncbi:MAG: protein-methionine-sulfoxide reductase catalytic subunit MsrP [Candidimonas sp.]|jgi:sulfoxide reductase catalytic subunit YedY
MKMTSRDKALLYGSAIPASEITPQSVWRERRRWIKGAAGGLALLGAGVSWAAETPAASSGQPAGKPDEPLTPERLVVSYNNYYEFGTDKADPQRYASQLRLRPWTVSVEGEVAKPRVFELDELAKLAAQEERIYRLRCVEAWSMVIPWTGYSLSHLLKAVEPTADAKYVEFVTATQPQAMPGLSSRILDWPYVEALRMDEAAHPLAMLVFGLYGKPLPGQNGAPVRLMVPWKYGFKSGKSIVAIRLVKERPVTSWMRAAPHEYGFYANVNPDVPHPRWSQATERRIGSGLFASRAPTLPFNGYGEQVASLYAGMDLSYYF